MQECKKCLHNNVCKEFASIGLFPNCKASSLIQKCVANKDCDCVYFREEIYGEWLKADCKCLECFVCSKCGETTQHELTEIDNGKPKIVLSRFCPNCGIRMENGK